MLNAQTVCTCVGIYFYTLEKARKKAGDDEYTSNDEKGRGKRRKVSRKYSDDSRESMTPPPSLNIINEAEVIWEHPVEHTYYTEASEHIGSKIKDISIVYPTFDVNNVETVQQAGQALSSASYSNTSSIAEVDDVGSSSSISLHEETIDMITLVNQNVESSSTSSNVSSAPFVMKIDKILKMVTMLSIQLTDLSTRFDDLEKTKQPSNNWEFFKNNFPCDSLDSVNTVDQYLKDENNQQEFNKFLHSIGGTHPKDKVQRIMRNLLTNKFATKCSWLGYRNNIRASDFRFLQLAKSKIILYYLFFAVRLLHS